MPEIFLPEPAPERLTAGTYTVPIFAVMNFPKEADTTRRLQWQAAGFAKGYVEWQKTGAPETFLAGFHRWIPHLWSAPQAPRRLLQDGLRRSARAVLSGEVLRFLLSCTQHHQHHATLERAKALVSHVNENRSTPSGEALGHSESLIEKSWADFRSASHLWLAWTDRQEVADPLHPRDLFMLALLRSAEGIRLEAERLRILKPSETWKAPPGRNIEPGRVEIHPLPDDLINWLDREFPG